MEERDLIAKLTLLQEIKPRDNWVILTKSRVLAQLTQNNAELYAEPRGSWVGQLGHLVSYLRYLERPALVFAVLAFVVMGGLGFQVSQNSLPGDALYSVRSALEKASMGSDPLASLGIAQRRLEDLNKVVQENKVKNLSSATQAFSQSVAEVSKDFLALVENDPDKALQASRELVQLQKDKAQIEQILGAEIGGKELSELQSVTKFLVESELNDLLERTLTAEQKGLLEQAIVAYQSGNYEVALEKIWEVSNR